MDSETRELELSEKTMREMVNQAMDRIVRYIDELPTQPAADVRGGSDLAREVMEPLPEAGIPYQQILNRLFNDFFPKTYNAAGPGYLAYIPGGGIFHTAVADLISDAVNRYIGVWAAAPALAQIEAAVARWFAEIVGYPEEARGLLTTGGSLANFTAIVTARHEQLGDNFFGGTIYASDQVHHSVTKAAILAGFSERNIRTIASDGKYRIVTDELRNTIDSDRRNGRTPFLIVGNAGSTNTGAVDDLEELSRIAHSEGMWLHVDGAYGAFFMLTGRGKATLRGIEKSDSLSLDPHKALFIPYGTGSLLVRNGEALHRAHAISAHYMPPMQEGEIFFDSCQYSPELSRAFRGLRVWLPLKMHGFAPFRRNLDEKLDLALWASAELKKIPGIEIVAEPQLTVLAFRLIRLGLDQEELNALNQDLIAKINSRQRVFLTGTWLSESFVIRICVLSFRTHMDRMEACLEDIRSAVDELR